MLRNASTMQSNASAMLSKAGTMPTSAGSWSNSKRIVHFSIRKKIVLPKKNQKKYSLVALDSRCNLVYINY